MDATCSLGLVQWHYDMYIQIKYCQFMAHLQVAAYENAEPGAKPKGKRGRGETRTTRIESARDRAKAAGQRRAGIFSKV